MSVDWSQFKVGDRVRVTFEGTFDRDDDRQQPIVTGSAFEMYGYLDFATSAELIERPFVPPAEGKLFRRHSGLFISVGEQGYRCVRLPDGKPYTVPAGVIRWSAMSAEWLADIEELDV